MKILRISQEIYPEVVGGGAYHAHALSRDQADMGHDVTVISIRPDINSPRKGTRNGYRIVQFPSTFNALGNDVSVRAMRYLRGIRRSYDIVHTHAHFYSLSNAAALFSRLDSVPMVLTNHSLISQSVPEVIARAHLKTVGRYTFEAAETIFCYTSEERDRLRELTTSPEIEVVSNGIDNQRFSPEGERSAHVESSDSVAVLFVGRFVNGKRPQDALSAFHALRETGTDAILYLCGDGPLREDLERQAAELGIRDSVVFLGLIDYDEMPGLYRAADVLVLPTRSEGFPRTVMEGLATGTPIIASHLDQMGPIVQRAGATVEPGDVSAFTERLIEFAGDQELRETVGEKGPNVLESEGLTWSKTVEETTEEMKKIVQGRPE